MLLQHSASQESEVTVQPINKQQQQRVCALTADYVMRANAFFNARFIVPRVLFDLYGRAAGMFRIKSGVEQIRYNPFIFSKYFEDNLLTTVPHEVAHYVTYKIHSPKRVAPHGKEWREIMALFNAEPSRTCNYDLTGIPVRQQKQFRYQCACSEYMFTTRRHNKVAQGKGFYLCRKCGEIIKHQS